MSDPHADELFPETTELSGASRKPRAQKFKPYVQNESYLFPPSTEDYVEPGHLARIVSELIDRMDLSELYTAYRGGGTSAYDPRMMLADTKKNSEERVS